MIRSGIRLVKNHGIPQDVIDAAVHAGKRFFALPEEEKMKVRMALLFLLVRLRMAFDVAGHP